MYYDSYDELASDANVDIVYVATTNQEHLGPAMMMLRAGKNVLVEKPTTLRYSDAKLMYEEAEVCSVTIHARCYAVYLKFIHVAILRKLERKEDCS